MGPNSQSVPRDYYVRMGSNDYSVHPQAIGRFVGVTADLESVSISMDGGSVGCHARSWITGQTIADPDHSMRSIVERSQIFSVTESAVSVVMSPCFHSWNRMLGFSAIRAAGQTDRGRIETQQWVVLRRRN
jgi:hypothetical protein